MPACLPVLLLLLIIAGNFERRQVAQPTDIVAAQFAGINNNHQWLVHLVTVQLDADEYYCLEREKILSGLLRRLERWDVEEKKSHAC